MKNSKVKSSIAVTSILLQWLCTSFPIIDAHASTYLDSHCSNTTFGTDSSTESSYKANIRTALSSLSAGAGRGLTYQNATAGNDNKTRVYAQYDCRGDTNAIFCQFCVFTAGKSIVERCPDSLSAIATYEVCILRYSNENFFGKVRTFPWWHRLDNRNISDPQEPAKAENFMHALITNATASPSLYSKGGYNLSSTEQRYGFVQCSRDLTSKGCRQCLEAMLIHVQICCARYRGWLVGSTSCFLRYEDDMFYEVDESPALSTIQHTGHKGGLAKSKIVAITIAGGVAVALPCLCIYFLRRRNRKARRGGLTDASLHSIESFTMKEDSLDADLPLIPLIVIERSTDYFSENSKLGEGGFGPVYKGTLPDGRQVAVKRLSITSSQGAEEFKNEVVLIAKLQHRNLVRLLGCCIEGSEKLLLYEYMSNSSLDFHLFGKGRGTALDFKTRLNIVNGIAKGLLYLHEDSRLRVIHRDLKASNILLDAQLNPKISDFGLARTFGGDQQGSNTGRVMGTFGYMSPEYAMQGLFSIKSDVFSFGVLLLEIMTGRKNGGFHYKHGQSLLEYAWGFWCEEKLLQLIDPILKKKCEPSQVEKYTHIGLLCVQEDAADRPTMSKVVFWLVSASPTLPKPGKPAFSVGRHVTGEGSKIPSNNDVTMSSVAPR